MHYPQYSSLPISPGMFAALILHNSFVTSIMSLFYPKKNLREAQFDVMLYGVNGLEYYRIATRRKAHFMLKLIQLEKFIEPKRFGLGKHFLKGYL